ncbi:zinc-ribbon domain-containing protein [Donghicola eburneus]|uniref:Putative membrane protein n=1 Tax=Donghicola eburneus TaxID=393278 RepID=A0A1M4N4K7_9RHOB|nr:zinc-ribbon domain-containing protein [Donghicola eburneus]SCM68875.1 putative membrane protein [Donghicola eburneus]SFQ40078.1 MJ0042 family finger-like domain-containing protein [Donghicola eburneus]
MRLTCPNCGAIYEVPDNVIPEDGRDVQCSNCAHTWFQGPATPADPAEEAPAPVEEPEEEFFEPQEQVTEPEASEDDEVSPEEMLDRLAAEEEAESELPTEPDDEFEDKEGAPAPTAIPMRRELDPMVREVLRQEAQFEADRRAKDDGEALESQPELGLDQPVRKRIIPADIPSLREKEAQEASEAETEGEETPEMDVEQDTAHRSRRDLLPDVEDINSTLRTREAPKVRSVRTPGELMEDPEEVRQRGFRSGFFLTLIFALLLAMFYVKAGALSASMPATAPVLRTYVEAVDGARNWLDTKARGVAGWLDSFSSENQSEG